MIPLPDPVGGHVPHAVVVPRPATMPSPALAQELLDHAAGGLAEALRPRSVTFAESLPRTLTGKINRAALRAFGGVRRARSTVHHDRPETSDDHARRSSPRRTAVVHGRRPGAAGLAAAATPAAAAGTLHVLDGPDRGQVWRLSPGTYLLGRAADCDLPLTDPEVSRWHCLVAVASHAPGLTRHRHRRGPRLGTGTLVDGVSAGRPTALAPGATIVVGNTTLSWRPSASRPPVPPAPARATPSVAPSGPTTPAPPHRPSPAVAAAGSPTSPAPARVSPTVVASGPTAPPPDRPSPAPSGASSAVAAGPPARPRSRRRCTRFSRQLRRGWASTLRCPQALVRPRRDNRAGSPGRAGRHGRSHDRVGTPYPQKSRWPRSAAPARPRVEVDAARHPDHPGRARDPRRGRDAHATSRCCSRRWRPAWR